MKGKTFKQAAKAYREACEAAGIEAFSLTEKLCKRRGDSWQLCTTGQHGFAELQCVVCEDGTVKVGQELRGYVAMRQQQAADGQNWTSKVLPGIKQRNGCPDLAPRKPPTRSPLITQHPQTHSPRDPFGRK
jgi:hypothetical protein